MFAALLLLNVIELIGVLAVGPGFWISFAVTAALLGVTGAGTFEHGASTLQLRTDPEDEAWWASVRERLLLTRTLRPQPARDDKVVTAWNGMAIVALAEAGAAPG